MYTFAEIGVCLCMSQVLWHTYVRTYILYVHTLHVHYTPVCTNVCMLHVQNTHMYLYCEDVNTAHVKWDLSIKDTLEQANLSTVERLSTLQR